MEITKFNHMHIRFINDDDGGFTTPAAAVALLLVCSLVFICARGAVIGSRSGQIQYVADSGALAADNVVAEFVTIGQTVDAALLSLSLLALTIYGVSAVAAFIPGAQEAAAKIAEAGSKVFEARDKFADSAIKGLNTAQKALPALCAIRASEAVRQNAKATDIPYTGIAITSPLEGIEVSLSDDSTAEDAAKDIESKEGDIQKQSLEQKEAQEREDDAKRRAWLADCGNDGMSMYQRAGTLSSISDARNPYYSSPDSWSFAVAIDRASAYYAARHNDEPGEYSGGSPAEIAESVARKKFYAYAQGEVSRGYVETTESGGEIPHLVELARNTDGIRGTWLYTDSSYPVSENDGERFIHAYWGCPKYQEGSYAGCASVCDEEGGSVFKCEYCQFSATTLGRVPSASTSIDNGFEYYYLRVVEASREYAQAVNDNENAKRSLSDAQKSISETLREAVKSLVGKRYNPQPPGRYGCICIVMAPRSKLGKMPFVDDNAAIPARVAISGATLAADPASDEGNVISDLAQGLVPQDSLGSGVLKLVFGAWGSMLSAYTNGTDGIKSGFKKILGAIPVVGTTISDKATSAFENALSDAGLEPADLKTYKPVVVNTSRILDRDGGKAAQVILHMKQAAAMYSAIELNDINALMEDIKSCREVQELLDEHGLAIAEIPLSGLGLGTGDGKLYLPMPSDFVARLEQTKSLFGSLVG